MKKINLNTLFPGVALVLIVVFLSSQMFKLPPLGKVFNPFIGVAQNKQKDELLMSFNSDNLKDSVNVIFDNRHVPHIFAKNNSDLYYVQGYVAASLRLWQMDFLTYVSAGRLSEIFGSDYLNYDRKQRRMGLLEAAKNSLEIMERDSFTKSMLMAYTNGVNDYIQTLHYTNKPLEYKLLDYDPEPWSDLKSVLIMKYMASTLSGYEEDLFQSKMILALGDEDFNSLYPDFHRFISPITGHSDTCKTSFSVSKPDYLNYSFLSKEGEIEKSEFNHSLGSNAWAVSGKLTKSGKPILCSDPHLNLSLPSIWLEMQLCSQDQNVYGVSIPGTPAIIIGFNNDIAWGLTNGNTDVKDWYKLEISNGYTQYKLNDKLHKLNVKTEIIKRRDTAPFVDTIYNTVYGPIVYDKRFEDKNLKNMALKWQLHEPSNEFKAFALLNQARNYDEYKMAIENYASPIQDFVFASKDGTISVDHQGKIPIRQKGEGKFIIDGTNLNGIKRYIPQDSLPNNLNPDNGYVIAANQHPTEAGYKYFYNGYYIETRANQIERRLADANHLDADLMKKIQLDNVNPIASDMLPKLINCLSKKIKSEEERKVFELLKNWNGKYEKDKAGPLLFSELWRNLNNLTWDELREYKFYLHPPEDYVLLNILLNDTSNKFLDIKATPARENADAIINEAFKSTVKSYKKFVAEKMVTWGDFNKASVMHSTNLMALSSIGIPVNGHYNAINAMSGNTGPSWRMIVELGDTVKAFGIYPGGQSGNFADPGYDSFVKPWADEKYYNLKLFTTLTSAKVEAESYWKFYPNY